MSMRSVLAGLLVVVIVSIAFAPRCVAQESATEKEIVDLENTMNAIYAANDLAKYFEYYAPDFTQWLPEGRTDLAQYKKEWTAFIGSGGRIESAQPVDMHIQISPSGDSVVASYLLQVKTRSPKGQVSDEDFQESDVWFKRDGVWKVVHLHYSPAPKKK